MVATLGMHLRSAERSTPDRFGIAQKLVSEVPAFKGLDRAFKTERFAKKDAWELAQKLKGDGCEKITPG